MQILKKNKRMLIGITIGVVIAVLLSTISCYVLAETLINSKDVVYEDNSNLVADNVQDAIDGTCSKIDTRLSGIEDTLYTIKNIDTSAQITTSTTFSYTGISVTLPANSYCTITGRLSHSYSGPSRVQLGLSPTDGIQTLSYSDYDDKYVTNWLSTTYSTYVAENTPVYLWASSTNTGENGVSINGFCATKYK